MSLDVLRQFENPSECWKIFRRDGDDLFSLIESNLQILQSNIFLDEKDYRKGNDDQRKERFLFPRSTEDVDKTIKYQKGWHCFTKEQEARDYLEYVFPNSHLFPERWYVCKVEARQVLAKGVIKNWKCVVVRKIKILDN